MSHLQSKINFIHVAPSNQLKSHTSLNLSFARHSWIMRTYLCFCLIVPRTRFRTRQSRCADPTSHHDPGTGFVARGRHVICDCSPILSSTNARGHPSLTPGVPVVGCRALTVPTAFAAQPARAPDSERGHPIWDSTQQWCRRGGRWRWKRTCSYLVRSPRVSFGAGERQRIVWMWREPIAVYHNTDQ